VDDLVRVLDWAAGDTPAVVGGLSFGGLASLHLALRRPDRVRALLLVDSGPGFRNPKAQAAWERAVEKTASYLERKGMEAFLEQATPTSVGLRPDSPAGRAAARAIAAQDPRGLARFARRVAAPAPPVIDRLGEIGVPALILVGEKDEPYLRAAEVMEAKLRDAERVSIPGAGHIANLDEPEAFNDAVVQFLRKLTDAGPEPSG
jgi:pimeloyl-ACP methyl ester carboxylesterase